MVDLFKYYCPENGCDWTILYAPERHDAYSISVQISEHLTEAHPLPPLPKPSDVHVFVRYRQYDYEGESTDAIFSTLLDAQNWREAEYKKRVLEYRDPDVNSMIDEYVDGVVAQSWCWRKDFKDDSGYWKEVGKF